MINLLQSTESDGRFSLQEIIQTEDSDLSLTFKTAGWSMFPTLRNNDCIELSRIQDYEVGDLVVFRQNNRLICHRISEIHLNGRIRTSSIGGEHFIRQNDILGKVNSIIRGKNHFCPSKTQKKLQLFDRFWIHLNINLETIQNKCRELMFDVFVLINRILIFNQIILFFMNKNVHYSIGSKAQVGPLDCYRLIPVQKKLTQGSMIALKESLKNGKDCSILVAQLAGRYAATFEFASGKVWLHDRLKITNFKAEISRFAEKLCHELKGYCELSGD